MAARRVLLVPVAFVAFALGHTSRELHCVGRVAHQFDSEVTAEGTLISVSAAPVVDGIHSKLCGPQADLDWPTCVGFNQDKSCAAAKEQHIPLRGGTNCEGCFLGVAADPFCTFNISHRDMEHVKVGLRGTRLLSTLVLADDDGAASPVRRGKKIWNSTLAEWRVPIAGRVFHFRISAPTEMSYEFSGRDRAHATAGVRLTYDLGDNSIEYIRGAGWRHHHDKPQLSVSPIREGDFNGQVNLTLEVKSELRVEIVDIMWFRTDLASSIPLRITSTGDSSSHLAQTCEDGCLDFKQTHEADVKLNFGKIYKHWGPKTDRHNHSSFHRCEKWHGMQPTALVVI